MASVRGHPFIVRLAFAFHTRDRAFLVSEFMAGGQGQVGNPPHPCPSHAVTVAETIRNTHG